MAGSDLLALGVSRSNDLSHHLTSFWRIGSNSLVRCSAAGGVPGGVRGLRYRVTVIRVRFRAGKE
jgi:hypothetical protein